MEFNCDSAEGGLRYENGQRYTLTVDSATEGESKVKGTPFVRLKLTDEAGNDAYSADIWNTPKAMFIAMAWLRAMGMKDEGTVNVDPSALRGIKLTAMCKHESYLDGNGKERKLVRWEDPLPITYDSQPETGPMSMSSEEAKAALSPKKGKPKKEHSSEEVPF